MSEAGNDIGVLLASCSDFTSQGAGLIWSLYVRGSQWYRSPTGFLQWFHFTKGAGLIWGLYVRGRQWYRSPTGFLQWFHFTRNRPDLKLVCQRQPMIWESYWLPAVISLHKEQAWSEACMSEAGNDIGVLLASCSDFTSQGAGLIWGLYVRGSQWYRKFPL